MTSVVSMLIHKDAVYLSVSADLHRYLNYRQLCVIMNSNEMLPDYHILESIVVKHRKILFLLFFAHL